MKYRGNRLGEKQEPTKNNRPIVQQQLDKYMTKSDNSTSGNKQTEANMTKFSTCAELNNNKLESQLTHFLQNEATTSQINKQVVEEPQNERARELQLMFDIMDKVGFYLFLYQIIMHTFSSMMMLRRKKKKSACKNMNSYKMKLVLWAEGYLR